MSPVVALSLRLSHLLKLREKEEEINLRLLICPLLKEFQGLN